MTQVRGRRGFEASTSYTLPLEFLRCIRYGLERQRERSSVCASLPRFSVHHRPGAPWVLRVTSVSTRLGVRVLSLGWHATIGPGIGGMRWWGRWRGDSLEVSHALAVQSCPRTLLVNLSGPYLLFGYSSIFFDHFLSFCFMQVPEFRKQLKCFWTVKKVKLGMHFFPL